MLHWISERVGAALTAGSLFKGGDGGSLPSDGSTREGVRRRVEADGARVYQVHQSFGGEGPHFTSHSLLPQLSLTPSPPTPETNFHASPAT